jgi:hypothetical protein
MTHLNFPNTSGDPFERCNIQFQQAHAIVWQIKFILSSKKPLQNAQQEFAIVSFKDLNQIPSNYFSACGSIRERL